MGAVLVVRDITRLHDLEEELRDRSRFHNIIGRSGRVQSIFRLVEALSDLDTTVLVTGESGTGKELVANALHYSGKRAKRPFVKVNCAALAENLLESELFGHVKGAFTGAIRTSRAGSSWPRMAPSCWTRSATYRRASRPSSCGSWRRGPTSAWATR